MRTMSFLALLAVGGIGFGIGMGPVSFRPFRGDVIGVSDEFEDIPLGQAQMFNEVPWCIRDIRWFSVDVLHGERFYRICKGIMGVAPS